MSMKGNRMYDQSATMDCMNDRVGHWCHQLYAERGGAKQLARDLNISERTAKNLMSGSWPCQRTLADMIALWGALFIQFITEPAMQAGHNGDIHALRSAVTAIQTRLDKMEAADSQSSVPMAHSQGGSALAGLGQIAGGAK